jgi:hypothetical protein
MHSDQARWGYLSEDQQGPRWKPANHRFFLTVIPTALKMTLYPSKHNTFSKRKEERSRTVKGKN